MANVLRGLFGLLLLPFCGALAMSFLDAVRGAAGAAGTVTAESMSLLGGIAAFSLCWATLSHPVRAYVLGHELTHALWGLLFGAVPSDMRVSASGGSVRLSKSNVLITLAPYFFPFYTFVVIVVALVTYAFLRPLPYLPLWMFLIGFTWAFHALFTLETLTRRQPDVRTYGRLFSWTLIFIVNAAVVLVWLATTTEFSFAALGASVLRRTADAYVSVGHLAAITYEWMYAKVKGT